MLRNLGFSAIPLHGQMSQLKRLGALNKFKAKGQNILVATDVASRCRQETGFIFLHDIIFALRRVEVLIFLMLTLY